MFLPLDVLSLLFLSLSVSHLVPVLQVSAALVNVTVDDTLGDPVTGAQISYAPQGGWQLGQSCTTCTAHPNKSLALDGTWHDSTFNDAALPNADQLISATFSFVGVAVYVFCIITQSSSSPFGNSDMSFIIDNVPVGAFQLPPIGNPDYFYNVPVYVNDSLSPGQHTITIVNGEINGNKSLTLLDYIVYTRVDNSTASSLSPSLTPTNIHTSSLSLPSTAMAAASSSGLSSSRRTVIIAVVASLGGVLGLVILIAAIIYCGRRRAKTNATPGSQNGVIASDAVPIDQEDPNTSGWVEGTWTGDEDASQGGVHRTPSNGRRKRGPSNASTSNVSLPNTPSTKSLNKPPPLPVVSNVQTRLPYSRVEPVSPSSSFGNLGSAPPDSATFFIPPPSVPPIPPLPPSAAPPVRPQRPPTDSDTFLDMSRSSFIDPSPPTRPSHPFATAQAYAPSPSSIVTRQRSDTNPSVTIPPPSASSTALAAATRGYAYATAAGPTRKRSDSDLERERRQQQQQSYSGTNPPSRQRSGSDLSNAASGRPAPAPGSRRRAGSDLEVNYPRAGVIVNPLAPTAPLTVTRQRSGSDLEKGDYAYSAMQSPSTFVSTLPSNVTTPTSMTTLMPKGSRSQGQGQGKEREKERERDGEKDKASNTRAAAPRRKVDPIDPSLQPPRDPPGPQRQPSSSRSRTREDEPQSSGSSRSGRRGGILMSDRDRERFGFLDVPRDASLSLDSRPPSYREASS